LTDLSGGSNSLNSASGHIELRKDLNLEYVLALEDLLKRVYNCLVFYTEQGLNPLSLFLSERKVKISSEYLDEGLTYQ